MKLTLKKGRCQLAAAYFVVFFGLVLIMIALFLPPVGVIDPTVLAAFGEILTFAGSLIGIDYHYKFKDENSKTTKS
ncbi:MAG: hypothetical protein MJZ57_06750 [Bacteroidales bacterium]|nr:hypothetical protein [Bacteroidales bacterium]